MNANDNEQRDPDNKIRPHDEEFWANEKAYGQSFASDLLEQYKALSEHRGRDTHLYTVTNAFFLTVHLAILSGLLLLLKTVVEGGTTADKFVPGILVAIGAAACGAFGLYLCRKWWLAMRSYRTMLGEQDNLLYEIEKRLPARALYAIDNLCPGRPLRLECAHRESIKEIYHRFPVALCYPYLVLVVLVILAAARCWEPWSQAA